MPLRIFFIHTQFKRIIFMTPGQAEFVFKILSVVLPVIADFVVKSIRKGESGN